MRRGQLSFKNLSLAATLIICIGLAACTSKQKMIISPDVPGVSDGAFRIKGRISYEGNKDYLPRTLIGEATSNSSLTFEYIHATSYGMRDVPALMALFNPLTFFGFPLGENAVTSAGRLSVIKGEEMVKSYLAICSIGMTRNVFSEGLTFSEMRSESLIAVRDNIESQLYHDREFLTKISHAIVHENR